MKFHTPDLLIKDQGCVFYSVFIYSTSCRRCWSLSSVPYFSPSCPALLFPGALVSNLKDPVLVSKPTSTGSNFRLPTWNSFTRSLAGNNNWYRLGTDPLCK